MFVPRGGVRVVVVALLAVAAAVGIGARCREPDTNVVVFIQGLYTTYYDGQTQSTAVEGPRFSTLKTAFRAAGYEDTDLLDYSYAGGDVTSGGEWRPNDYDCELTDRPAEESIAVLETMLRDYADEHPKAHFTLVGHSLGGYIAYEAAVRQSTLPEDDRLPIDAVITLGAPLQGVAADKKAIIDQIPCDKTYIAGAQIVADKQDPMLTAKRSAEVAAITAAGMRLATLGNANDCLWNTGHCLPGGGWIDDSGTQLLPGANLATMYEVTSGPFDSHDAILGHPPAVEAAVAFAGAP